MEYLYFKAAGQSLAIIEQFEAKRQVAFDALKAFMAANGLKRVHINGCTPYAVEFLTHPKELPAGLRYSKKHSHAYVPHMRLPAGKEWAKKLNHPSLSQPDWMDFAHAIGGGPWFSPGYMHVPMFERVGSVVVIHVPKMDDGKPNTWVPPEAIALKTSEYWQLREAADAAKKASGAK